MKIENLHVGMIVYVKDLIRPYVRGWGKIVKKDPVAFGIPALQLEVRIFEKKDTFWVALEDIQPPTKLMKLLYEI